jgi:hypothetical protein
MQRELAEAERELIRHAAGCAKRAKGSDPIRAAFVSFRVRGVLKRELFVPAAISASIAETLLQQIVEEYEACLPDYLSGATV